MQRVNPNQCQGHEKIRICHTFKNMIRWVAKILLLFVIISIRNDLSLRISVLFLPSLHTVAKSIFCSKIQFPWILLQHWIWIFAQKMEFLEVDFLNKKLSFASVCTTTKYVKCILWPLFVLFQCSSRVDLVPKIGVITFRRRQLFRQCCWQLRYFSSNKSSNILKKMMSYSRIMLTLFFGTWNVF